MAPKLVKMLVCPQLLAFPHLLTFWNKLCRVYFIKKKKPGMCKYHPRITKKWFQKVKQFTTSVSKHNCPMREEYLNERRGIELCGFERLLTIKDLKLLFMINLS